MTRKHTHSFGYAREQRTVSFQCFNAALTMVALLSLVRYTPLQLLWY